MANALRFGVIWFVGFLCGAWSSDNGSTFRTALVVILVAIGTGLVVAEKRRP